MYLDSEKKKEIFGTYGTSSTDTGSAESQIALFSYRIAHLTEHLKANRKDYSTQRALTMLVGKRRSLLTILRIVTSTVTVQLSLSLACVDNLRQEYLKARFSFENLAFFC